MQLALDQPQRQRICDDLQGIIKGELLFDEWSRSLYSTDASIFQVMPLGIVVPRDENDIQTLVRYAAEHEVPLMARGAGTGVAGESLGAGIVVDLSQHFRSIAEIGNDWVRVQPGVTLAALNERLAELGRRFAPDPASSAVCTIGGMIANNASGSHALKHGYTRDHVRTLRVVLDSGDAMTVGKTPLYPAMEAPPDHLHDIVHALAVLHEQNAKLIDTPGTNTPFDRCGYLVHDVFQDGAVDLARLLTGSEGTLALITEGTLQTIPLPGGSATVLLGFPSLDGALRAVQRILTTGPTACDLIDRRLLRLARGSDAGEVAALIPSAAEAVLLVDYEADSAEAAQKTAQEVANLVGRLDLQALNAVTAWKTAERQRLWQLRDQALPSLYGLKGGPQPLPVIEDVGVPLGNLSEFLRRAQAILKECETTASFLVHAGTGQVHTRPFLNLQRDEDVGRLKRIAELMHTLALDLGGTVSSQHATGLARTPWVARQYGPLYDVFRQLKAIFDPKGIFNPGKKVDPYATIDGWPLRTWPRAEEAGFQWRLRWQNDEVAKESGHCNGCGQCRSETVGQRMCPIFRATHAEPASPRAKANLLRHLLDQAHDIRNLSANEVREIADLCVHCKMCAWECPAKVNIPKLMLEAKAANVAEHGLDRTDFFLAQWETWARLCSGLAPLINFGIGSRTIRWLLHKVFGLSPRRRLPRFARRTFVHLARRQGLTERPRDHRPRVTYFLDSYANYCDPQIGEAVVAVLRHHGFSVFVPPGQRSSGLAPLVAGDVDLAREIAQSNVRTLAAAAREGDLIVCSEPTAALLFRQEYLDLLDDPDARLVAEHTVELTCLLGDWHRQGRLRTDFERRDLSVGHHVPCHLKALGQPPSAPTLLSLIPGMRIHVLDVSCSGMAGTFGFKAKNYQLSRAAGRPMLEELDRPRVLFGSTECSSCRLQMEDSSGKRTLHPIQYLAWAYGLLPHVERRLVQPLRDLVLS